MSILQTQFKVTNRHKCTSLSHINEYEIIYLEDIHPKSEKLWYQKNRFAKLKDSIRDNKFLK